jgi:RNA polymerase sigma-70 factor (ECF subfamily)
MFDLAFLCSALENSQVHTEKELFARIAQGDGHAYSQIFRRYFEPLRSNAFKLLKSEFWAEEIVQEVFLHLWLGRKQLVEVELPASYLYRITANRCLNRMRRQELEVKMQYLVKKVLHGTGDVRQENSYDLKRLEILVAEAVEKLPEQQRRIFLLQQEKGLSYQEIADCLGISKNTVRNHMVRTLQNIRCHLQQSGELFLLLFSVWYLF